MTIHAKDIYGLESMLRAIVKKEIEAAFASAGQPDLLVPDPSESPIDQAMFGGNNRLKALIIDEQYIEIKRLINIFENISMHASFIYKHLLDQNTIDEVVSRVIDDKGFARLSGDRKSAMRKAATMRDSAIQMARLLRGEDLEASAEEEITGGSRD
jgi:hypothetical protein